MSQTKEAGPALRVGMRIKLIRGMPKYIRKPDECYDYMGWIAGNVPVGSVGTIYKEKPMGAHNYQSLAIHWDGIEPKPNYYFGLGGQEGDPLDIEIYEEVPQDQKESL